MLEFGSRLDASVALVRDRCSVAEFKAYQKAAGRVMAKMLLEVMNLLYDNTQL